MKTRILYICIFLCFPIAMLIAIATRQKSPHQGQAAAVWLEEVKMAQPSPAIDALKKMGVTAVPTLQQALKSPERHRRFRAAWVLGQLGASASNAVPDLIEACEDKDPSVQIYAMQSLKAVGTVEQSVIPKLMAKLENPLTSTYAAELLQDIDSRRGIGGLPPIPDDKFDYATAFMQSPIPNVRLVGARELSKLPKDERVTLALNRLLNDTNGWVRQETAKLVGK